MLSAANRSKLREAPLYEKSSYSPAELNDGFVVAITIEAKEGQADAVGAILGGLVAPTLAEPGVKLFIPYRSPTNPLLFFLFELTLAKMHGAHIRKPSTSKPQLKNSYRVPHAASAFHSCRTLRFKLLSKA